MTNIITTEIPAPPILSNQNYDYISFLRTNNTRKTPAGLDCLTASIEEFVVADDENYGRQRPFGVCTKLKNIIDTDSVNEKEMSNAALFPPHPT
ncbi:hypothetical protein TNCV_2835281 [Trichonephila clavipes]|uniref:Uncharacterized protein n=1 Tax=Trichonephila clavipes TaxID=2585209 RepID=A0A8X6S168_TRICX|nr:hypothetical protein TNCV_2835281 [Trichonephila clavipes]